MIFTMLAALALFLVLLYYALWLLRAPRPFSRIPGPVPLPIIGSALEFGFSPADVMKNLTRLWQKHGYLYQILLGPHIHVVMSDAKFAEAFLTSKVNISKTIPYRFLNPWLGTGLLTSTGEKWRIHRKIITPTFHFKILENFIDTFNSKGNILINKLRNKVGAEEFDVGNYISLYALDVISESAMGVTMNVQENSDSEYVRAVHGLAEIILKRTFRPWLFPDFVFYMTKLGKQQNQFLRILHNTTNKVITSRREELLKQNSHTENMREDRNEFGQKRRMAFLDLLLQYTKEGEYLTDREIREEVDTFMFEGHDTVSSALSFCLMCLAKHPICQDKAYQELCDIFGESDREATAQDILQMKYLECVIKETLRLYPSAPFFQRKLDEDITIDGVRFKAGTNISMSPVFMHRNPEYFPNPETFDPTRFCVENNQKRNPFAYVPFSAGPRNCVGQRFAMLELKATLSKLLRNFKFLPVEREIILSSDLVLRSWGAAEQKMWITTFLPLAVLVLLIIFFQYYVFVLSRTARHTGNYLPGPKSLPIIGAALALGRNPVDVYKNIIQIAKEYGNVCKAWMGPYLYVLIADPVFIEPFFTSNVNIRKSMSYEFMQQWLGTGLLTSLGRKWKSRRKIITPAFHFKILEGFIDTFNTQGNTLIRKLKKHASGPAFDIYKYINMYSLDVICDAAMGVQLNVQDDQNCEYVAALHEVSEIIVKRTLSPWYFPEFIFRMSPLGRRQKALIKILHNMSYKVIRDRKMELANSGKDEGGTTETENDVGQKKRLAFLDMLLDYDKNGGNLSLEDIREEVDTFMFEGHDTTTSGLCFTLWSLAEYPDCQQKAYEELYEIFGNSDRDATSEDLTKMKYLECVIKETLRFFPSVPFFLRELDEDIKIEGINFVAGTTVMLAPAIMHKHPQYFPDPEKFDPERFTLENARGRHPYAYVPFSAGPRNCIGQKFAMMEMKAAVTKILRNYKLISSGRENVLSMELILRTVGGIHIKLENR